MPFIDSADSLRAKAHLSEVGMPAIIFVMALALLVAFLLFQNCVSLFTGPSFSLDNSVSSSSDANAAAEQPATAQAEKTVVAYIVGAVVSPGVYEVAEGSRVQAVVEAAGGLSLDADGSAVNLARVVSDGEQIVVPAVSSEPLSVDEQATSPSSPGIASDGKVNINLASSEQLQTLNGIGESIANKIIDSREQDGPFSSLEDLKRVSGIGDKKYAAIAGSICI